MSVAHGGVPPHSRERIGGSTETRARNLLTMLLMFAARRCGDNAADGDPTAPATELTTAAESGPLVGRGEVELVEEGYGFTEGPQWMPDDGMLLFTDLVNDTIHQVAADDEITVFPLHSWSDEDRTSNPRPEREEMRANA